MQITPHAPQIDETPSFPLILRSVQPEDEPFLLDVYADHRKEELDQASWTAEDRLTFLSQQFNAQLHHYRTHYPHGSHDIVVSGDTPIGRIYIDRGEDEYRLLDISLLTQYRNKGIGAVLMGNLIDEADRCAKPVKLYVYKMNRAVRFYERLGFNCIEDTGVHYFMERLAG